MSKRSSRRIHRQGAEGIATRRHHVRRLHLFGVQPSRIVEQIQKDAPGLLAGQADPLDLIKHDLEIIRRQDMDDVQVAAGLPAVAEYVARQTEIMRSAMALSENESLPPMARLRGLSVARQAGRDIARAQGVPVDAPALQVNILAQLAAAGIVAPELMAPAGVAGLLPLVAGGRVDPVTFATSEVFCNLPDVGVRFPMQETVLRRFMSPTSRYTVLILVTGMRSGKGVVGSVVLWYAVYELLSLEDPQRFYGLTPNQEIQVITMATSERQAKNNVFQHVIDRLETGGPWFQALRDQADILATEIRLPKNVVIRCGHSRASTQVGSTSYLVVLDELARMKDTEGRDNADEVYDKMSATTATFGDRSRVLVLTSPEWEGDKSMRLLEEAVEVDDDGHLLRPHMLGLQMPSWEANLNLPFEVLWQRFDGEGNPMAFWRDFGARPPTVVEGYYPDPERWERQGDDRAHPYGPEGQLAEWFKPCCDSRRYVHIDLGATRDACGLAMAHKPVAGCPWYKTVEGQENPRERDVVLDVAYQLVPARQRQLKGEISFEYVRQLIFDWQERGFNVKGGGITFDGWQSLDSRQILRRAGYKVGEFSLDKNTEGHDTLLELINRDRLAYYRYRPLIDEGKRLQLLRGKKVDHPKGGSKDVVDAVAGAAYHAHKRGGRVAFVG